MAQRIAGKAIAVACRGDIRDRVSQMKERGMSVGLAGIIVGEDSASKVYVANKHKACADV